VRILVTGAAGLLGSALLPVLGRDHDAVGVDLDDFDVTREAETRAAVRETAPEAIVHAAAWADVDGAESALEDVFRVNGVGAKNVALAANDVGARMLHLSTDYVFDGLAGRAYVESDPVSPVGVYGRSKWMGERFVREVADDWTIVRTQALYGARGPSFVRAILGRVDAGEPLSVVDDQTVCPTRAADLAEAILRILEEGTRGTYHASSRGECTWHGFAAAILEAVGKPDHPLSAISSETLDRPAPRPAHSVLRNLHLELTIGDTLPHWRKALSSHLEEVGRLA